MSRPPLASALPTPSPASSMLKAMLWGGALAGSGDLIFAFLYYGARGASATRILQSVAGGWLGPAAFQGGAASAVLGFFSHYLIAVGAAATFMLAARRLPILLRRAIPSGLLFGVAVYFFMNLAVVPLSAYRKPVFPLAFKPWEILAHAVLVGLPIALVARRFLSPRSAPAFQA